MNQPAIAVRNFFSQAFYRGLLKPGLFIFDPENVHDCAKSFGKKLGRYRLTRYLTRAAWGAPTDGRLTQIIDGITFPNPIGLAAGFDKNAELVSILPSFGFGFMEVGSITGQPCAGNPRPRLWRLPRSQGLVVYYGLANEGVSVISQRLAGREFSIPLGTNVAMTNCQANLDLAAAVADYRFAFEQLTVRGQYFTVNISCPNARGGQPFSEPDNLDRLLSALDRVPTAKPVWIKLSPDLNPRETDGLLAVLKHHRVHGVVCSNLTKSRHNPRLRERHVPEWGGISGRPVRGLADHQLARVYRRVGQELTIVGVGGISSAVDAYRKIRLGASLVQVLTGLIYRGPQLVSEINRRLLGYLERDGLRTISEAVGIDNC